MDDKDAKVHWATLGMAMRTLQQAEGWDQYVEHLTGVEQSWIEKMISATEAKDFSYSQGFIQGLRAAKCLPSAIIRKTDQSK